MSNAELLRRYVEGRSEEAFAELVKANINLVYSSAMRQLGGDSHRAQEVTQAVFTDLARKAPSLSRHTALVGWLYTSTHFAAAKLRRGERRRHAVEREASIMNLVTAPESSSLNGEILRPLLDKVLNELSGRDRDAVLLRYFEQRTYAEIGEHLGLGENAARMVVDRALNKLGGLLSSRRVNSTAAALELALVAELGAAAPPALVSTISAAALTVPTSAGGLTAMKAILGFIGTAKFAGVAAFVGLAGLATAFYEARNAHLSATALQSAAKERDLLRQQLTTSAPVNPSVGQPSAEHREAGGHTGPEVTRSVPTSSATATSAPLGDPSRLARYHERFDGFVQQRGLTPAQAEQFFQILCDWDDARRDFQDSIRQQGLTATPEAQKLRDQLQQQIEVQPLIALLGHDGERAYFAFEESSVYRSMVEPFAKRLADVGFQLTNEQLAKFAASVKSNMHTVHRDPTAMGSEAFVDWPAVEAEAAVFLNRKQLRVTQAIFAALRQNVERKFTGN